MIPVHVLGSTIGQIFQPIYEALAWTMAFFYALIPNYAVAIGLLTVAVMVITAPLTVKTTRSTIAMQKLAPEMKKLQAKYKQDKATLNEEMMKLYREHNINPAGGCLPMLIQLPVFVVLYGVIRGLTNTVTRNHKVIAAPRYISKNTRLFRDLIASPGHMKAFGLDLESTLFSHHTPAGYIPYGAIIAVAIGLQYLQMRQLNSRNKSAQANPQMQMMQRYMPLIFAVIYIRISAGVNVYFVVSSLCRIGIQEAIFRSGMLEKAPKRQREEALPGEGGRRKTLMERLADAQQRALEQQKARQVGLQAELAPAPERRPSKPAPTKRPPAASGRPPARTDTAKASGGPAKPGSNGAEAGAEAQAEVEAGAPPARPSGAPRKPGTPASKSGGSTTNRPRPSGGTSGRSPGSPSGGNGAKSSGNGAGEQKPAPTHPRSADKRPRKAR